jgi:hypothetical protein
VIVFNPSMSQADIQTKLNAIATQQVPNQFGTQRYAIFVEPGTYGSSANPLIFQVGYYTQVAGLGAHPGDVTITGSVPVWLVAARRELGGPDPHTGRLLPDRRGRDRTGPDPERSGCQRRQHDSR